MDTQDAREPLAKGEARKIEASRANAKWMIRTIAILIGVGAILLLGQPIYWKLVSNIGPLHGSTMNMAKKQLERPSGR